LKDQVL